MADIGPMLRMINDFAAKGIMLPRTEFEMAENLRDFSVATVGGELAGCCALHFYTPEYAEIRSLAVSPSFQGYGAGRKLVQALVQEAQEFGLIGVFAFTYIPMFFGKLGFTEIDRGELPLKAWKDCLRCPKFQCCDEIAVILRFGYPQMRPEDTPARGPQYSGSSGPGGLVPLPVVRKGR
jgi:amino-acid N-acetyltransferase